MGARVAADGIMAGDAAGGGGVEAGEGMADRAALLIEGTDVAICTNDVCSCCASMCAQRASQRLAGAQRASRILRIEKE